MPRENRLCSLCNSNQVEDEIHFFFQCNKYSVQRQAFINQINQIIPDFDKKSSPESIKLIINLKEHHVNHVSYEVCFLLYENTWFIVSNVTEFFQPIITAVCFIFWLPYACFCNTVHWCGQANKAIYYLRCLSYSTLL